MASKRKSMKSKFLSEDVNEILNSLKCENSPIKNKIPKLTHDESFEEDSRIKTEQNSKKKQVESHFDVTQKIFNVTDQQLIKREKSIENLLNSLSDIISQIKVDNEVMTHNEKKLEQVICVLMKCIHQSTLAREENLKNLEEVYKMYKNKFEEMYLEGKTEKKELNEDINKLQEKLISDAKRSGWEAVRNNICHVLQNEFRI